MSNYKTYGEWCVEIPPDDPRSEILNSWRISAYEQNKRIAELETKIRHNALWQASEDAEERAHLEKLVPDLKKRIAELSQAVGLITTLKPTMAMDVDHPLDMAKEVTEYVTARIAELEYQLEDWTNNGWAEDYKARIAELEALVEGHDPFEDFPPKERGFDCSVMVLGKFEYEDEFTSFTNWDLCVYWFDEERWHPLNGHVKGDDIVSWYELPSEERAK